MTAVGMAIAGLAFIFVAVCEITLLDPPTWVKAVVAGAFFGGVGLAAIQLHGALGFSQDTPLAKWYTQVRSQRLVDGPDEVHLRTVARHEIARARERLGQSAAWFTTPEQMRSEPHLSA